MRGSSSNSWWSRRKGKLWPICLSSKRPLISSRPLWAHTPSAICRRVPSKAATRPKRACFPRGAQWSTPLQTITRRQTLINSCMKTRPINSSWFKTSRSLTDKGPLTWTIWGRPKWWLIGRGPREGTTPSICITGMPSGISITLKTQLYSTAGAVASLLNRLFYMISIGKAVWWLMRLTPS